LKHFLTINLNQVAFYCDIPNLSTFCDDFILDYNPFLISAMLFESFAELSNDLFWGMKEALMLSDYFWVRYVVCTTAGD